MRAELEPILKQLLARPEKTISLDAVGEAIGCERISPDEIEQLFAELEKAHKVIGGPGPRVRLHLAPVLEAARRLQRLHGKAPTVRQLADATGLSAADIRTALLYASVMGR